jgi:hypothetical protein
MKHKNATDTAQQPYRVRRAGRHFGQPPSGCQGDPARVSHAPRTASGRTAALDLAREVLGTPGQPPDQETRALLEWYFGCDFGRVRIHTDAQAAESARAFAAQAYTAGEHIVFAAGRYSPRTWEGLRLLAHEAAHVCQQRAAGGSVLLRWDGPDPACERAAEQAAEGVSCGRPLHSRSPSAAAAAGSIQCHADAPCPGLPDWVLLQDHRPREIWLPANQAIEQAFANDPQTKNHVYLLGSQFNVGPGFEIRLPRGIPNKKLADEFLQQFKGIANQLAPDVMDFTDRVFYEIKTPFFWRGRQQGIPQGILQLQSYYNAIESIRQKMGPAGGPPWDQSRAWWFPPHTLPFPGDARKRVCTQLTEYTNPDRRGLVLYNVLQFLDEEEKKKRRAAAAAQLTIQDLATELNPVAEKLQALMRRSVKEAEPNTEFRMVASPDFFEATILAPGRMLEAARRSMLRDLSSGLPRSPALQMRLSGWAMGVPSTVATFAILITLATGGADLAVLAAGGAVEAGPPAIAAADLLALFRGMKAANDVAKVAVAAGVICVVGQVNTAEAAQPVVRNLSTVRAVPIDVVQPPGGYSVGRNVQVEGKPFHEIGTAMSGNGET